MHRPTRVLLAASGLLATLGAVPLSRAAEGPPAAEKRPVTEQHFGVPVHDDYRWLEDWSDPAVRAWVESQNTWTRGVLDHLPSRTAIRDRVAELSLDLSPHYSGLLRRGGTLFAMKDQPPKNQPMLVALTSLTDLSGERVVLDPNAQDSTGATTIDFFVPSPDGSRVAVSQSKGGTESGDVRVFDTATGRDLGDLLLRVNGGTAGGDVAWTPDGGGFWYTRCPLPGEAHADEPSFHQQVWFHVMGTPQASDTYVMGRELPRIAEISFDAADDGRHALVVVRNGDGGEIGWWLRGPDGAITPLAGFTDRVFGAAWSPDALYLLSRRTSPKGEVIRVALDHPSLATATTVVPASDRAIDAIHVAGGDLCVTDQVGGPMEMRRFTLAGKPLAPVPVPPLSSITGFVALPGGSFAIGVASWTEPERWLTFDARKGSLEPTALAMRSPADFSGVEVKRTFAVSRDGTRVPISLLMKRGTVPDGRAPLLLYGYGGYGISQTPGFQASRMLWLEQGGIFAIAHLRGGREFGEAWHEAGKLTHKQNVFDDFAACARAVVEQHWTTKDHLVIQGGSNGGLLMGAEMTQHPELFGAVVSSVGVYDMPRSEAGDNGQFNVTEYGTVQDSAQFRALLGYSPYHHVKPGTTYPPTLLLTGVNDPRVPPSHSFKFASALQASGTPNPVLLRTSMTTGHIGMPLNARNELNADIYSFIFAELGLEYRPVAPPRP